MKTTKTLSQYLVLFLSAGLLSAVFVTLSTSSSLARDRDRGGHHGGFDRGGGHGGYGRHGSRRHVGSRHSSYRYSNRHHYLSGVLSGFGMHYLFRPHFYSWPYYSRTVYVTEPRVTVIERPATLVRTSSNEARSSCLQEREYQTTVIVGGREVEAYGTACLQPDGSWLRGPAKLVPQHP
jgi:hypothetical protein